MSTKAIFYCTYSNYSWCYNEFRKNIFIFYFSSKCPSSATLTYLMFKIVDLNTNMQFYLLLMYGDAVRLTQLPPRANVNDGLHDGITIVVDK